MRQGARSQFSACWRPETLVEFARQGWLRPSDYFAVRDVGTIRACAALSDQSAQRQLVVAGYTPWLRRTRPIINLAARLTGSPRLPAAGKPLRAAYLSLVSWMTMHPQISQRCSPPHAPRRGAADYTWCLPARRVLMSMPRSCGHSPVSASIDRSFTWCAGRKMPCPSSTTTRCPRSRVPMKKLILFAALLIAACAGADQLAPRQERTAYVGAMVWDGEAFRPRDIVVEGDHIVDAPASSANHRVELSGSYVVPPFCEAHNHNLGMPDENEASIARYLREGIFYVGILSNLPAITDPIRHTYNTPTSVDVIFANGPLTASGGHPIRLREFLLERGVYPGFTRETLPGQGYFVIDNEADLARLWPTITGLRPDFIKIILVILRGIRAPPRRPGVLRPERTRSGARPEHREARAFQRLAGVCPCRDRPRLSRRRRRGRRCHRAPAGHPRTQLPLTRRTRERQPSAASS